MSGLTLVVGSKRFSSWSLRPWLALRHTGLPFTETVIELYRPETKGEILKHNPTGKVPVLTDGDLTVWDSLAIVEYLAEIAPEAGLWPEDGAARAVARSMSAEMHSGFAAMREHMPMDLVARRPGEGRVPAAIADVARITAAWRTAKSRFGAGGPFLFGEFSAADCMYAPVVARFDTYAVELDPVCRAYADAVLAWPALREWTEAARGDIKTRPNDARTW